MKADLHTHSTASDGQYHPAEVVEYAARAGLNAIALTDHDTVDGLPEALDAGRRFPVRVIRGVEFSAAEYPCLHILGYAFNPDSPVLNALCLRLREGRAQRQKRILDYLHSRGIPLTEEQVLQNRDRASTVLSRPHFARVMVRYGYAESVADAFARYLGTEEFMRTVERPKPSARECVETIRNAGGHVSLAHPCQLELADEALCELVEKLVSYGLEAVECFYPQHTPAQVHFYRELAARYDLHITGGSYFHGEQVKPGIELTPLDLDMEWLGIT